MNNTCDILVLGGGGSGLTAAARAASGSDKRVILLEKSDFWGGGAIQAGDYRIYGSRWQKGHGCDDHLEEELLKYMDDTNWQLDPKLVRNTFLATGRFFDWICSFGPEIAENYVPGRYIFDMPDQGPVVPTYRGKGRARGGTFATKLLIQRCRDAGVDMRLGHKVVDLIMDGDAVVGAKAEGPEGAYEIQCRACVLATGSWINNQEVLEKVHPKYAKVDPGPIVKGGHRSSAYTGDGLKLAKTAGALLDEKNFVLRLMGPLTMAHGQSLQAMSNHPYSLQINLNGKRWTCEPSQVRMGIFRSGHLLAEQPEGISFVLFDKNTLLAAAKDAKENPPTGYGGFFGHPVFPEDPMTELMDSAMGKVNAPFGSPPQEEGAQGSPPEGGISEGAAPMQGMNKLFMANTLAKLAEEMGVPANALEETVSHYNACCEQGFDDEFFKPRNALIPLTGPYFALRCNLGTDGAFGGILVNPDMQAYKSGGGLVPGLYATGDFASGRFINDLGFKRQIINDLSWAFASGLMAGENALRALNS